VAPEDSTPTPSPKPVSVVSIGCASRSLRASSPLVPSAPPRAARTSSVTVGAVAEEQSSQKTFCFAPPAPRGVDGDLDVPPLAAVGVPSSQVGGRQGQAVSLLEGAVGRGGADGAPGQGQQRAAERVGAWPVTVMSAVWPASKPKNCTTNAQPGCRPVGPSGSPARRRS
jgi:hypothetical protein